MSAVQDQVLARIRARGRGRVFIPKDFLDLGSRDAADQALSRLAKIGAIERLGRGLYLYPRKGGTGVAVAPADQDEIAAAIGRQTGSQVVPSGAMAASRLGLTRQVPAVPLYLTDGRTRRVTIDGIVFQLRHAAPKDLPAASQTSSMVFQALRYFGKESVDERVIARIRKAITPEQRAELLRDASYSTDWISAAVRLIARDETEAVLNV
jgi:hypothetical protein